MWLGVVTYTRPETPQKIKTKKKSNFSSQLSVSYYEVKKQKLNRFNLLITVLHCFEEKEKEQTFFWLPSKETLMFPSTKTEEQEWRLRKAFWMQKLLAFSFFGHEKFNEMVWFACCCNLRKKENDNFS